MPAPPTRITAQQVAKRAKVSLPAVYQALNGTGRMRLETRERVLAVAKRLGFRLNRSASSTKSGRHDVIGLLVANWEMLPKSMFFGLALEARKAGFRLLTDVLTPDGEAHVLSHDCVDGLLVFEDFPKKVAKRVDALHLPVIRINTNQREGEGRITFDEEGAACHAARVLAEAGCRTPVYVVSAFPTGHYSEGVRQAGFLEAARRLGLRPRGPVVLPEVDEEHPTAPLPQVRQVVRNHRDADAFVLYDDRFAAILIEAFRQEGRAMSAMPRVMAFGESWRSRQLFPPILNLRIPEAILTRAVLTAVHSAIQTGILPPGQSLSYEWIDRASSSVPLLHLGADTRKVGE